MYSSLVRASRSGTGEVMSRSIPHRNADSVLPEPVGDNMSVFSPDAIRGHPSDCGGVGSTKEVSNHVRTAFEKGSSADSDTPTTYK